MWPTCHLHDIIDSPLIADQFPDHCADQFSAVLVDCDAIPDLSEPPPPAPRVGLRLEMTRQWIELQLVLLIFGWLPNLRYLEIPFPFFASSHTRTCGADLKTKGEVTQNHKKKKKSSWIFPEICETFWLWESQIFDGIYHIYSMREQKQRRNPINPYESIQWRELLSPNMYHPKTNVAPDKWWLEDHLLFRNGPFSGDMAIFGWKHQFFGHTAFSWCPVARAGVRWGSKVEKEASPIQVPRYRGFQSLILKLIPGK